MLCQLAHSFEMIIVGRLMIGLACGAFTSIGPTYLYEVSPPAVRGTAGSLNQLMCVFSLVLSQLLGLKEAMNTEKLWPILLGNNCFLQSWLFSRTERSSLCYYKHMSISGSRKSSLFIHCA